VSPTGVMQDFREQVFTVGKYPQQDTCLRG